MLSEPKVSMDQKRETNRGDDDDEIDVEESDGVDANILYSYLPCMFVCMRPSIDGMHDEPLRVLLVVMRDRTYLGV